MSEDAALVLLDREGTMQYVSGLAETLFGHSAADLVGRSIEVLIPPGQRERHWAAWRKAWAEGRIRDGLVAMLPVVCAAGEVRRFAGRLLPVPWPHGELVAAMGVWTPAREEDASLFAFG